MNFELLPARRARGRVLDPDGGPVPDAYVAAAASGVSGEPQKIDWPSSRTGPDGVFEIRDLRPDLRHVLFVRRDGFGAVVYDFPPAESSTSEVDLGDITLRPAGSVAGIVSGSDGEGVPGVEVVLWGTNRDRLRFEGILDLQAFLQRAGERGVLLPGRQVDLYVAHRRVFTDSRGRFQFTDLAAGSYEAEATLPPGDPVEVVVEDGKTSENLILRLDSNLAIEGRVVDPHGRGVSGAFLSIEGVFPSPRRSVSTCSSAGGSFRFEGLLPVPHRLRATPPPRSERIVDGPLTATTVAGIQAGTKDVTVVLARAAPITGKVVDGSGLPIAAATVVAEEEGGTWVASARSDAEGRFSLIVREGDRVQIRATLPAKTEDGRVVFAVEPGEPQLRRVAAGTKDLLLEIRGNR